MRRLPVGSVQQHIFLWMIEKLTIPDFSPGFQQIIEKEMKTAYEEIRKSHKEYEKAETHLLDQLGLLDEHLEDNLWSEQKSSKVFSSGRWDAEFYRPMPIELLEKLKTIGGFELGTIADISNGYPWNSSYFLEDGEDGEPFVRIRNCKPGIIDITQLDHLVSEYAASQQQPKAQSGDLVVGMDGLKWFYAGLIQEACYVNQRIAWIHRLQDSFVSSEYLMLVINSMIGQTQLLRQMTIAHTVGHITNQDIRHLFIPKLSKNVHDELTEQVHFSFNARRNGKRLLEQAIIAVEIAIEESEAEALKILASANEKESRDA
jgi:type I restriction enzyme, S subunit